MVAEASDLRLRRKISELNGVKKGAGKVSPYTNKLDPSRHDKPIHVGQDSLFSSSSGWTNYKGFLNLIILLLVVSNGRVALENLMKYGILVTPLDWIKVLLSDFNSWFNVLIILLSNVSILLVLGIEKLIAANYIGNRVAFVTYGTILCIHITLPAWIIAKILDSNPLFSCNALLVIVVQFLKLWSYVQTNYWCRNGLATNGRKLSSDSIDSFTSLGAIKVTYPQNLTLRDMYYFMVAPTLCYELNFPRTPGRRKSFLTRRLIEFIFLPILYVALCQQWIVPLVKNGVVPFSQMNLAGMTERIMKLAIPNLLLWLLMFYTIFHSLLNLIAELIRFADREFYVRN
uniref:Diacylglycerol O-acyltransferase 1 n=1 Tax=Rhabditophanes sp. KR3021 TaxID=114890 RepID=A0AC35U1R9_9BILA